MEKRLINLSPLVFIALLSSCINMADPEDQASYKRSYNSFDNSLVDHLPNTIPNSFRGMGFASLEFLGDGNDYAGMHITTRIASQNEYSSLRDKFASNALGVYSSLDSSLLIINTYGSLAPGTQGNLTSNELVPIPQYAACIADDSTHLWEREEDLEIILLDFGYEDLVKRLKSKQREDLPEEYSVGFSKGVSLNRKDMTIQRWMIVW